MRIALALVATSILTGCETLKTIDNDTWVIAGSIVVTGILLSKDDNKTVIQNEAQCYRLCPGRCVKPILCP